MTHLLKISDLSSAELLDLLQLSSELKLNPLKLFGVGSGRSVAILFEKPSLRTRFSVEAALARLGATPLGAYDEHVGMGTREPVADVARVLGSYVDAIVLRTYAHLRCEEMSTHAGVTVVNALSDLHHPLQALGDILTLAEEFCAGDLKKLSDVSVAWVGDANNVARSLLEGCALLGIDLKIASPEGYEFDPQILTWAANVGRAPQVGRDPKWAVEGASAVYTDVWASMGREHEHEARKTLFEPYQINDELMSYADADAIFLHCLPAHRGEEVTVDVIDGPRSRVWVQAENRLHTVTAVLARILEVRPKWVAQ